MLMRWEEVSLVGTPTIKNHSATLVGNKLYIFGGFDGRRNHSSIHIFDCEKFTWKLASVNGTPPPGRNGHTATLADDKIYIIGGWLGSGPFAASDMHILDIDTMTWTEPRVHGTRPGPCNMHTADFLEHLRSILVFRGGDGREYLNDLHAYNVDTMTWSNVITTGTIPVPRANHSSSVVGNNLFIFGGWDGHKRLNAIHILDTETMVWSTPEVRGVLPQCRAGMTLTSLRDRLFLFGGSGHSTKCFNDLQVLHPQKMAWIDTVHPTSEEEECALTACTEYAAYGDGDANPNDNPQIDQIVILGNGPGRRAGHTSTVVNRRLFVFGGSYGSEYLNDFYILDTDPPPLAKISSLSSTQILQHALRQYCNTEEFSDIAFIVEGRRIYGHKVILSLLSDRFRAMLASGFRESSQKEIVIEDIRYEVFLTMIEYLYTGTAPELASDFTFDNLENLMELLQVADQFMLDHLKQYCESLVQAAVRNDTVEFILEAADRNNAIQLQAVCKHFIRNAGSSC